MKSGIELPLAGGGPGNRHAEDCVAKLGQSHWSFRKHISVFEIAPQEHRFMATFRLYQILDRNVVYDQRTSSLRASVEGLISGLGSRFEVWRQGATVASYRVSSTKPPVDNRTYRGVLPSYPDKLSRDFSVNHNRNVPAYISKRNVGSLRWPPIAFGLFYCFP